MTEKNAERVERQKQDADHGRHRQSAVQRGQLNENDNNKNRKYESLTTGSAATYAKDSKATLQNQALRPVREVLPLGDGPLAGAGRNRLLSSRTTASSTRSPSTGCGSILLQDFTDIYHLDLHGNVRKNPKLSGTTHNVFGIQVGVGITRGRAARQVAADASSALRIGVPEDLAKGAEEGSTCRVSREVRRPLAGT